MDFQLALWGVGIVFGLGIVYAEILMLKREAKLFRKMLLGNGDPPVFVTHERHQEIEGHSKDRLDHLETRIRDIEARVPRSR